jgi:type IV pilus assembly protein PilM
VIPLSETGNEVPPPERKNVTEMRLAEFFAKEKIITKNVTGSISGNQVIVRYVRFPKLSREELNKTIQFEAEPYIPFDIREVNLSYHILGEVVEEGQKKMEAILVAAKKDVVQARLDIFNDLNLRAVVVDIDGFALANAYEISADPSVAETVLLINIGHSVTNMAIVENHVPRVVRDVFISGNSFTKAIQKNVGCDVKAAEDMKSRYCLLVTAEEKEKTLAENQKEALQVSNAVAPVAKELLLEIQKSIDFYISQNPERSVHRVLLSGGSADLKNLDKYLHQELRLPVEILNPLKNIAGGESVPQTVAPQLAIAVGLAVRHENDMPKK